MQNHKEITFRNESGFADRGLIDWIEFYAVSAILQPC